MIIQVSAPVDDLYNLVRFNVVCGQQLKSVVVS